MSIRKVTQFLSAAAWCLACFGFQSFAHADPQVIVHDPFTDGDTLQGEDPLDVRWFTSDGATNNILSVVEDVELDPVSPHRVLDFLIANTVDAEKDDYLFFSFPDSVAVEVGRALQVRFNIRFAGGLPRADASRTGFALVYRSPDASNSPWADPSNREYSVFTSFGNAGLLGSIRKSNGAQILNVGTGLKQNTASVNLANAAGDVFFEVARVDETTMRLRYRLNGGPIQETFDTSDITTNFNRFYLRYRRAESIPLESLRLDEVTVQLVDVDFSVVPPQTWHVSASGSNQNLGTETDPFASVGWALQWASAGDTIRVGEGNYRETVTPYVSGEPGAPIVVEAALSGDGIPESVVIDGFDILTPSENGMGEWSLHEGAVWKISLPPGYGRSVGRNMVEVDGELLLPARWPTASAPVDFGRSGMATSTGGGVGSEAGPQAPYSGENFRDGYYFDPNLVSVPDGHWDGAHIDVCAGHNWWVKTGVVTGKVGDRLDFRYQFNDNFNAVLDTPKQADRYAIWGHLNALDQPGEFFLDINGLNGPANTLYLWLPDSGSPVGRSIGVLRREHAIMLGDHSRYIFRNINVRGGTVTMNPSSTFNHFDGVDVKLGSTNRNMLIYGNNISVRLAGSDHVFENGSVRDAYGRAVSIEGTNIRVSNSVLHNASSHLISAAAAKNSQVDYNTAFRSGSTIVDIGAKATVFEFNHIYYGGLRITDIALMNTWNSGDMQGTEVRYNWVHTNLAPRDNSLSWWGGQGIRLDSGHSELGCSNALIHHNVVWNTSTDSSITFWGLTDSMVNHGDAKIFVYHNTVSRALVFGGAGSVAGNDVRNNIARNFNNPTGGLSDIIFGDNLFSHVAVAGNLEGDPGYVSQINHNYQLAAHSEARGVGETIPGISETSSENYLGAYNPDAVPWRPGARLRPQDLLALTAEFETDAFGQSRLILSGLPIGRTFPDSFGMRLSGQDATGWVSRYDFESHKVEGVFSFDLTILPLVADLTISLDGTTWVTPTASTVLRDAPVLENLETVSGQPDAFVLNGQHLNGFTRPLIPLSLSRLAGQDFNLDAIPWIVDTTSWVELGMAPDGSDLRILKWDGLTPIRHHVEYGISQEDTLIWLLNSDTGTDSVISFENRSQLYLSYGDLGAVSIDDPSVLTDSYPALGFANRILHLRGHDLAGTVANGGPVSLWNDYSPNDHPVIASNEAARPILRRGVMGDLPAVEFDGIANFLEVNGAAGLGSGPARFFTVYRNPDPGTQKWQRLYSARDSVEVHDYVTGYYDIPNTDPNDAGTILAQVNPTLKDANRQGDFSGENFQIGRRSMQAHEHFRGQIAELIGFSGELVGDDRTRLLQYLNWKYGMTARPQVELQPMETEAGITISIGDQAARWIMREEDGSLRFGVPTYTGEEPFPATVDLVLTLPDGQDFTLVDGFTYTSADAGEPTTRYTYWSLALPSGQRAPESPGPDGRPNLLRFAHGMPATAHTPPSEFEIGWDTSLAEPFLGIQLLSGGHTWGDHYTVENLVYRVKASEDLITWQSIPWAVTSAEAMNSEVDYLILTLPEPSSRAFFRLQVQMGTDP